MALDRRLKDLDQQIADTFDHHPQAAIIQSMPGFPADPGCHTAGRGR